MSELQNQQYFKHTFEHLVSTDVDMPANPAITFPFKCEKAIEYSNNMMNRRGLELSEDEINILKFIATENT